MRKIRFRVWDIVTKTMRNIMEINFANKTIAIEPIQSDEVYKFAELEVEGKISFAWGIVRSFDEVELMQFTGLYDKNGKEIYEGDIVRIVNNLSEATKLNAHNTLVKYKEGDFVTAWNDWGFDGTYGETYNHFSSYNTPIVTFEIIGNKFDNPELLEVENGTINN